MPPEETAQVAAGRILAADDSKDNQLILKSYITQAGLGFDLADNGRKAIDFFQNNRYDIIFLDVLMPEMNGIEVVQQLREIEKEKNLSATPVIALTALSEKEDIDKCLAAGFDDFIEKPVDPQTFNSVLGKYLKSVPSSVDKIMVNKTILPLVPDYLQNRKQDVLIIQGALEQGDYDTIRVTGHKMKGSGKSYGFEMITEIGKQIEIAGKEENIEAIKDLTEKLRSFLENVVYESNE